jgi:hypothetical protein
MHSISETLRKEIERRGVPVPTEDEAFDLLALIFCTVCCEICGGGNASCPPDTPDCREQ